MVRNVNSRKQKRFFQQAQRADAQRGCITVSSDRPGGVPLKSEKFLMATQFTLSGTQLFAMAAGESITLISLATVHVYRVQNEGPGTIRLEWDSAASPLSLEAGRSIDLQASRVGVATPSVPPSGPFAVGWYSLLA